MIFETTKVNIAIKVKQSVKVTSIATPDLYTGDLKTLMETGYALAVGIMVGTTYKTGYSLTSTAKAARRAGIEISYVATVPTAQSDAILTAAKAVTPTSLITWLSTARDSLGVTIAIPTVATVSVPVITPSTPDPSGEFSANVNLGVNGSATWRFACMRVKE